MVGYRSRRAAAAAGVAVMVAAGVLAVVPGTAGAGSNTCQNGQYKITLTPDPGFVKAASAPNANDGGTLTVKATITNNDIPDPSQMVFFNTNGDATFTPTSTGANPSVPDADPPNTYRTTLKAGSTLGSQTITAVFTTGGVACPATAKISQTSGAKGIALTLDPAKVKVSSPPTTTNKSTATATVQDTTSGLGVDTDTVTLKVENCDAKIEDPNNPLNPPGTTVTMKSAGSNGKYNATIDAGTTAGQCTLTATDGSLTDQGTLVQYGDPATIAVTVTPSTIVGDGTTTAVVKAEVKDSAGNGVPQVNTTFASDDGDVKFDPNPSKADDNGVSASTLTSSQHPGPVTVFAFAGNVSAQTTYTQTQPVNTTALKLSPPTIPADGASTSQATVSVLNNAGNPVADQNITFASNGDAAFSSTTAKTGADGKATVTITASKTVGKQTITATNTSNGQIANATLVLETPKTGYWLVASDGGIFSHGAAGFYGSEGATKLNKPIVGMAATPSGKGYWLVATDGGIFSHGDAGFFGSEGATKLNKPIVGMAATPSGKGYWLVASDGGIFAHGDAGFFGSTGNITLNKPIVGMTTTPTGKGYWLVATDGGIFSFGDATFFGSEGATRLNQPIVGMASTPSGKGYWLVASDGGIFAHGDAGFFGSTGNIKLNKPVVGMASTATGKGYWFVATDGGIFNFGDAPFLGSEGATPLNKPIVGMAALRG